MSDPGKSAAERLATQVQYLKGVGPRRAEMLERLGLRTVADVLFFFPRDYEDHTDRRTIADLEEGSLQSVRGLVEEIELRDIAPGRNMLGMLVRVGNDHLRAVWFNQPFLFSQYRRGQEVLVSGKPKLRGLMWQMVHPRVTMLGEDEPEATGGIVPIYPLTEGLQQWHVRRMVRAALDGYAELLEEAFTEEFLAAHNLTPLAVALPEIHFPTGPKSLEKARRRFVYQELFILQLALAIKRQQQRTLHQAEPLEATARIDARIRRLFPFELTAGQEKAIAEIAADMASTRPMNRLLQGDVGSGKTIVAAYAMLLAVAHGSQAVLMAPTEILARQHALTLKRMLAASEVRLIELVGGLSAGERSRVLEQIAEGEIDLIVGTQAVIQEDVRFKKIGLAVIDEQHKFGVRQRALLRESGGDPHYLVMTATPIPRTVTMTLFGDLDVSTLADMPPGRQKIHTYLPTEQERERWWSFFSKKLQEGRQGYVVTPLVDESETVAAKSLEESYEALANGPLEAFRLGLVHGRMKPEEKDAVMAEFRSGEIQVLVSTSVVEVGVDVPNATLMTIESGQRFGLAQLHQLRGRISRGRFPGYCAVFADDPSEEAAARLKAFSSTTDGFKLAEVDFSLRGPGELFGTRQHGLPPFRIADLSRDKAVVEEARRDAQQMVDADPGLASPSHARLRRMMLVRYGKALDLGDVG
ncbi:MAG: ATP-dependent DNA helicase RecG [Planctomycetaceae bacterium]|nr:ATP-dependent DNA helicase RecG [Planctomycetaceae bacterium]